jgi:branched-chain amino acid aminotransferase
MEQCLGKYFIINDGLLLKDNFFIYQELGGFSIYEIIRIESRIPLFVEDHLKRLFHSLELENLEIREDINHLEQQINKLIANNDLNIGKIKVIINFYDYPDNQYNLIIFFTEYSFPDSDQYKYGVKTILCQAVRNDPNAKVLDTQARKLADTKILEKKVYEALLVDSEGYITEGSRSNFFAIKDNKILTPPDDSVLQGIARKKVLEICRENKIHFNIQPIHQNDLPSFESVFITGTSLKVLPVSQVDALSFCTENELLNFLMVKYNEKIENYIKNKK